jgi:cold shock protein
MSSLVGAVSIGFQPKSRGGRIAVFSLQSGGRVIRCPQRQTLEFAALWAMEAMQLWRPSMARGTVKWFNSQKGYGFIQPQGGGKDVFVHISAVEKAGLTNLNEGQSIEYEEVSNRGKTSAENLKIQR